MTSEKLREVIDYLWRLKEKISNGNRDGWGYDNHSLLVTIAMLQNEKKMMEEEGM